MTIRSLAPQTSVSRSWVAAAAAVALYLLGAWSLEGLSGLVRTIVTTTPERHELEARRVTAIDLDGIDTIAGGEAGVVAIWRGTWEVPSSGLYDLALASEGPSSWTIDGVLAHETATFNGGAARRIVWLAAGFHAIEISYRVDADASTHRGDGRAGRRAARAPRGGSPETEAAEESTRASRRGLAASRPRLHRAR